MAAKADVQDGWEEVLARIFAQDVTDVFAEIGRFKIGEGHFVDVPPKTVLDPDPTFLDLASEGTPLAGGGTAIFTNASAGVVGTGTSFLADVSPGDWIKPGPTFLVEGLKTNSSGDIGSEYDDWGQVQTVVDDLNITLVAPYIGPTVVGSRAVHKAAEPHFVFRKALTAPDVLFLSANPAITEITGTVLAGEANLNQLGNNPDFFEFGVFDVNNVMLVHMSFPLVTKTGAIQLNQVVELEW